MAHLAALGRRQSRHIGDNRFFHVVADIFGRLGFLRAAATLGPLKLKDAPLSVSAERELAAVHRALITWHLEKDLRSARVLREMRHAERH